MTSRTRQLARPIGEIVESIAHLLEREGHSEDPAHRATGVDYGSVLDGGPQAAEIYVERSIERRT